MLSQTLLHQDLGFIFMTLDAVFSLGLGNVVPTEDVR